MWIHVNVWCCFRSHHHSYIRWRGIQIGNIHWPCTMYESMLRPSQQVNCKQARNCLFRKVECMCKCYCPTCEIRARWINHWKQILFYVMSDYRPEDWIPKNNRVVVHSYRCRFSRWDTSYCSYMCKCCNMWKSVWHVFSTTDIIHTSNIYMCCRSRVDAQLVLFEEFLLHIYSYYNPNWNDLRDMRVFHVGLPFLQVYQMHFCKHGRTITFITRTYHLVLQLANRPRFFQFVCQHLVWCIAQTRSCLESELARSLAPME